MIASGSYFSPDRLYRYSLYRIWDQDLPLAMFVGLNPSTADETRDDPTIRRCIRFARYWGYGGLVMGNIYAWRSTDPKGLATLTDPVGPENNECLESLGKRAAIVIAAWGANPGPDPRRPKTVAGLFEKLHVLGLTKGGQPRHPLYMRADTIPQPWRSL